MSLNKVILIGNIATDIDLKYTPNGNGVASFNLAVNEFNGDTTFIPVETWKKQAENVANYCGKGSKVAVEGSIKIDKWEKDGQKRSFTKVNAFNIQFLESKGGQQRGNNANQYNNPNQQQNTQQQSNFNQSMQGSGKQVDISDSDLPF